MEIGILEEFLLNFKQVPKKDDKILAKEFARLAALVGPQAETESNLPITDSWKLGHCLATICKTALDSSLSPAHERTICSIIDIFLTLALSPLVPDDCSPRRALSSDMEKLFEVSIPEIERENGIAWSIEFLMWLIERKTELAIKVDLLLPYLLTAMALKQNGSGDRFAIIKRVIPMTQLIKALLLLKSNPNLKGKVALWIHKQLLDCVQTAGGLRGLTMNLALSTSHSGSPEWSRFETIGKIVGAKGHTKEFHASIVAQAADMLMSAVKLENGNEIAVSVVCLNQLLKLNSSELYSKIETVFVAQLKPLCAPQDLLTGLVVMEEVALTKLIRLYRTVFRGSAVASLSTRLVSNYLPLLFSLAMLFEIDSEQRKSLEAILTHCLSNSMGRMSVLRAILFGNMPLQYTLHPRVGLRNGACVILAEENDDCVNRGLYLVDLLKRSNNNLLIFDVFMDMLKEYGANETYVDNHLDPMAGADAMIMFYQRRLTLVAVLSQLIAFKPFHFLFAENGNEIIDYSIGLFEKVQDDSDNQMLLILMAILQEFMHNELYRTKMTRIKKLVMELQCRVTDVDLQAQLSHFALAMDNVIDYDVPESSSSFEMARKSCEHSEPFIKVYGMRSLIKLLKAKDKEALSKAHVMLLLAMDCLKHNDSYVFLCAIQVLVKLADHLEATVIETLIAEYEESTVPIDVRLNIGEAIIKVVQGLGVIAFRYKELLINCFMRGIAATDHEFRLSCLVNVGQVCKLLSYQVSAFFHELLSRLKGVLEHDDYQPCRRACALVLSELIQGMDNLLDFQDILLPVYRLLKHVMHTDADDRTRLHAQTGVEFLSEKVSNSLLTPPRMEKEIKIFDIK